MNYVSTSTIFILRPFIPIPFPAVNITGYYLQDFSTPISTVARFTSNTSNYTKNISQDWSTPLTSTGSWAYNVNQNWSTPVSTATLFTSNTSNYAANILQNWSSPLTSTTIGLGTVGYVSVQRVLATTFVNSLVTPTVNYNSVFYLPVIASAITTNQTVLTTAVGTYFFYTSATAGLTITLPSPANGWNVTIQNTSGSSQNITVLTTPNKTLTPGSTLRFFSDGVTYYFI